MALEQLCDQSIGSAIIPGNKCHTGAEPLTLHQLQKLPVIQEAVTPSEQRIINNKTSSWRVIMPRLTTGKRTEGHQERRKTRKEGEHRSAGGNLLIKVSHTPTP